MSHPVSAFFNVPHGVANGVLLPVIAEYNALADHGRYLKIYNYISPVMAYEDEFEPMFTACEAKLSGKKIALFGSYGWGDGEWMRNWDETCRNDGAVMACDFVICNDAPDEDAKAACEELGKALA